MPNEAAAAVAGRAQLDRHVTHSHLGRVVLWMMGALLSFCVMAISIRALAAHITVFEILSLRSGSAVLALSAILAVRPALRPLIAPKMMWLHLLRNSTHYTGQYMWAVAITLLPLATVFSLEFTMPAWTALLATLVLGERMNASRLGVVVLGLIGVLIILRPGMTTFQPASLLVLSAAFVYAVSMVATKRLTVTQSPFAIVFWMNVMQFPMSLAGSSFDFPRLLTSHDILPILGVAVSGLSSHYCLSNAFRAGDAMVVVPLDFLRIPLIAALGWWIYGEKLDMFVFLGALVIVSGVIWNLHAETRRIPKVAATARPAT
jgi:drug/metabolite transporter (DMT)-like permease